MITHPCALLSGIDVITFWGVKKVGAAISAIDSSVLDCLAGPRPPLRFPNLRNEP